MWTNAERSLSEAVKISDSTIARYNIDGTAFIGQACREAPAADFADLPYEVRVSDAVEWFSSSNGRWSKAHIRRTAAALRQRVELLIAMDYFDQRTGDRLLFALEHQRPSPAQKRAKKGYAKSIKPSDLRRLIAYFKIRDDEFSKWITGYILIASRIGWRPGELFLISRNDQFLRAPAEKHSNGRGLFPICEIDISSYPSKIIRDLDEWIVQTRALVDASCIGRVLSRMNRRIETACKSLGVNPISAYTLRHFAIACMKASGFSPAEIAVIVNHAASRTATERYGKKRSGIRRAKKMLRFDEKRLEQVRDNARPFSPALKLSGPAFG
ncbi:integrase family protein [Rhodopseudomonas palustris TIE-1]|nr:integrase family protein [Rhodopseudomonas palustris TIE-1]